MFYVCTLAFVATELSPIHQKQAQIIEDLLGSNSKYNRDIIPVEIAPNKSSLPVIVRHNIYIRSIEKIDTQDMDFKIQITFRQQWKDERLQFDDMGGLVKYVSLTDRNKIWIPDIFFSNEKNGHFHDIMKPNQLLNKPDSAPQENSNCISNEL